MKRIVIISAVLVFAAIAAGIFLAPSVRKANLSAFEAAERLIEQGRTEEGLAEIRRLAEEDNTDAMVLLGSAYVYGRYGLEEQKELGFQWHLKAAEAGDSFGQYMVGRQLASGSGVSKDPERAVYWWRKSAEAGFPPAQLDLGAAYRMGIGGLEKDMSQAVKWIRLAAENGFPDAQAELGIFYSLGHGVAEDDQQAEVWMRKAAEQGSEKGMQLLGLDKLVAEDYPEALKWLTKSAATGDSESEYWLGTMYEAGRGVDRSMERAIQLYESSAEKGYTRAEERLAELGRSQAAPTPKRQWFVR